MSKLSDTTRVETWPVGPARRFLFLRGWLPALVVAAAIATIAVAAADFALADWRHLKPIGVPAGLASEDLVEVTLDREVFQDSASGQADLRLIRDDVQEVAYQLVLAEAREEREFVPVKVRDLGYLPGQHTSFVVDIGEGGSLHNEVEIFTSDKNFRRRTVVESSTDAETWAVIQEGTEIYDFTVRERNFNVGNTRISYPESAARYLRVQVVNGEEGPLKVTGAGAARIKYYPPGETAYRLSIVSRTEDVDTQSSVLILDSGSQGIPVTRLSFQTEAVNFHRDATIEVSNDQENWQWQGEAAVYSYSTPRFVGNRLEIQYPESRHRYYRVTVQNRDNPPLPLEGITLLGVERKVIFQAQPGGNYALYYGNPNALRPSYDLERVLPYYETAGLPAATLGAQQSNPAFALPEPPVLPWTERYPWFIPVAVTLAALVVGLLLFGVVRQAKKILPPPDASPGD